MESNQATLLDGRNQFIELGEAAIVATPDSLEANPVMPDLSKLTARIRALTIAMVGILAMPLCGLMAGDEIIWEKLQSLIAAEKATTTQSTVLAVDTAGLTVRSKSASVSTKELFEQAVMEHLARLHHTFNSWSERKQELMGTVSLKLMVDAAGNVVRVEPVNSHVNNSSFVKTVMDDVRDWKFPKDSAEAAEITVPLLFIPKGMDAEMIARWERKVRGAPSHDNAPRTLPMATAQPVVAAAEKVADLTATAPTAKPKAQPNAPIVVVANRSLAMRDNPRYSANSVREVQESTQLSVLESRGDWLKVRAATGGQVGFVRKEYVSPVNG